ncbi:MAG: hypothetical protein EOP84_19250, partial [Verrucomicrobiaceae bacterium]
MKEPMQSWADLRNYLNDLVNHNLSNTDKVRYCDLLPDGWRDVKDAIQLGKLMDAMEVPHLPEVEAAISLLSNSGETNLAGFSTEALTLLRKRAEYACAFAE